jgi:hypothetical protein
VLFGSSVPINQVSVRDTEERQLILSSILRSFRIAFQEIHFELCGEINIVNAQALVLDGKRQVILYGGLAFSQLAGENAIVFTLLHEVGHHLANGCVLPWSPSLACECTADHWAVTTGADILAQSGWPNFSLEAAINEYNLIIPWYDQFDQITAYRNRGKTTGATCWAFDWGARQRKLLAREPISTPACPLSDLVLSREKHGD